MSRHLCTSLVAASLFISSYGYCASHVPRFAYVANNQDDTVSTVNTRVNHTANDDEDYSKRVELAASQATLFS
jgi:hypothetical protein